jgi:hypothetical protein
MNINITYQYEKLKRHTEYAITNGGWKLIDYSLSAYSESLRLDNYNVHRHRFDGISHFYLRVRDKSTETTMNMSGLLNSDPWGRKFVCFPPDKFKGFRCYGYQSFDSHDLNLKAYVIVTTVNSMKVYCVDVIKDFNYVNSP